MKADGRQKQPGGLRVTVSSLSEAKKETWRRIGAPGRYDQKRPYTAATKFPHVTIFRPFRASLIVVFLNQHFTYT